MTFRQFAFNNVTRNKRMYAAFFLSSVFCVMIFFMYAMFIFHPGIVNGKIHWSAAIGMGVAQYVIYLFAFLFLFYSVSAFLKKREKEFGILVVHGMSSWQRNMLIFWENMLIGLFAIIYGIGLGMVLAKLFFMAAGFLLEAESLPFYMPWKAIGLTVGAFLLLFIVITLFTLLFLKKSKPLDLLQGSQKPKTEPKASKGLSLLAAGLLLLGYGLALFAEGAFVPLLLIPVTAIVIVGTYFLFTQLSVYTIHKLKKNRRFYWRKTNLVIMSDLAYRMKDNARMFFFVCIISTVAFCAIGSLVSYANSFKESAIKLFPYTFTYSAPKDFDQLNAQRTIIENKIHALDPKFTTNTVTLRYQTSSATGKPLALVKQSDYNRLVKVVGWSEMTVNQGEAILIQLGASKDGPKEISFKESGIKLGIVQTLQESLIRTDMAGGQLVIVPDQVYEQISTNGERNWYGYVANDWEKSMPMVDELRKELSWTNETPYQFFARVENYLPQKQLANTMLFVGFFVGVLFFVAAGSFLYFRLYMDLDSDKRQYSAITRIGLTEKELKRIVTTQVALLFFIPIIIAVIHSSVAFVSLQNMLKLIGVSSVVKPTAAVLACFLVVQVVYFWLIRNRYLHHLKQVIR
ncbi:FtsX-like permease family protein [Brevibacillus ginsengisoli]|uniref:FtsX-like permease family protein n=1 Tax=Brevibacillus ginsengisoli TaxID=363854 RepID=UPI003CFA3DFE